MKKKVNRAFNRRTREPEAYKNARNEYKYAIRKAQDDSWKKFCESCEGVPETSRMHKILSKDATLQVGVLKTTTGELISDDEAILNHLIASHFPGSTLTVPVVEQSTTVPTAESWSLAKRVVTPSKVGWAIKSFKPFKAAGSDGIFPALLQHGGDRLCNILTNIFRASIAFNFIPSSWRDVRIVFIPKPGRISYEDPRSYRAISLMSFFLKTSERLVDRYIGCTSLIEKPIHANQHAYQKGKSVNTAIHKVVHTIESAFDSGEFTLGVFLDIEGAFDRTNYNSISCAANEHGVHSVLTGWIEAMLMSRVLKANLRGVASIHCSAHTSVCIFYAYVY
jgi:hypothetical protein